MTSHVLALGIQAPDGTIQVTDVLTANFPPLTQEKLGALFWALDNWCKEYRGQPDPFLVTFAAGKPLQYRIDYNNDTGPQDDYFREYWTVTDDVRSFVCDSKQDADFLCAMLNQSLQLPAIP